MRGFCEIVIPNWSEKSRPRWGLKRSATTVIFAFWFFQFLERTGVFNFLIFFNDIIRKRIESERFFLRPLCLRAIKHYFLGKWHIYNSTATTRIEEQMAIGISNCYRHVLQCHWWCINVFHHRNVIIVWRIVIRIKLFIIVYLINILILRLCILLCSYKFFYIIDATILTRVSCNSQFFSTYLSEMDE